MKRFFTIMALTISMAFLAGPALAGVSMGEVTPVTPDLGIQLFGSLKSYPHFVGNLDFNDERTGLDWMLDESGVIDNDEVTVRNQFRFGAKAEGENWKFLTQFESDFTMDKGNVDRGHTTGHPDFIDHIGMTGEDFGVEKLEFNYDFTEHGLPMTVETGWNDTFVDIQSGGLLYGDDHPYFSLFGDVNGFKYELLAILIFDQVNLDGNGDEGDWQAYTAKVTMPLGGMQFAPFYGYSDNQAMEANVHYLGFQTYGKMGNLKPKAEFIYAMGDKDTAEGDELDVSAFAGFAALEVGLSDALNPYFGGYYMSGDSDANDDDIEVFHPITNISRYAGPFGIENAIVYRLVPALGTDLYDNSFNRLGGTKTGYGGISNNASANGPGMYSLGIGTQGGVNKWSYKTQLQYFFLEETGALEDVLGNSVDDTMGWEWDLQITYHFNPHFSLGNVLALFDPGDAVEDINGEGFDEMAIANVLELKWQF